MQNQSGQWLNVRRDRPDYMIMWGWGALQPTAIKEAVKIGFPMNKFISIWWPSEDDARGAGDGSKGFKTLNWHAAGGNFPFLADIEKYVVDKGKSQSPKDKIGTVLYNRGVYNSMLIAEAIRTAQKITGKALVTGEDVRRGLESLNIDATRLKELGMEGFAGPIKITCTDHNGHRPTFIQEWDGTKYVKASDLLDPLTDKVMPLLESDAKAYSEKNAPWPKRTEQCDAKS
jgi:branched-chain amino acid transport system substrate-binding protein